MLDPKLRAELEQAESAILEFYPPMLRKLYLRLIEEGFDKDQSLSLVMAFIKTHSISGKIPS